MSHDPHVLPANLPVPIDDGRARHLVGRPLPRTSLRSTSGEWVDLSTLGDQPTVLFSYPRTGVPGQAPSRGFQGEDWDEIPGARGCTPQSCAFRDLHAEFAALGVRVLGLSTQSSSFQSEFKARNHVPFEYLSDVDLALVSALSLPTFEFPVESGGPNTLIARMAWFVHRGHIEQVWYPVFPPHENASQVLAWLKQNLPLFLGLERDGILYRRERALSPSELSSLFASSGIGRPSADLGRLGAMLTHANLIVTARSEGALVGVARAFSDFAWCTYLSDLAVHRAYQARGIGRTLVELCKEASGPGAALILVAAPDAESYYPRLGLERIPAAFRLPRRPV